MKISPMANTPGMQNIGNIQTSSASPDRRAAATAIAMGQSPMQMVESDTPVDPLIKSNEQNVRRIKMRVNQSPDRAVETQAEAPIEDKSIISSNNEAAIEETRPLNSQAAAFAKARRALQQERASFEREKAQYKTPTTDGGNDLSARLKSETLRVLQEQGALTPEFYNTLTDYLVSGKNTYNPEMEALKQEIKSLKEGVDKRFVDTETQAEESALTEMLYEAEALAKEGDTYDLIRRKDAYDRVLRHIHTTYKQTGRVLDVTQAMNKIEADLEKESEIYFESPKFKSKFVPQVPQAQIAPPQQGIRTITNRDAAAPAVDRRARAIMAALGQNKRG